LLEKKKREKPRNEMADHGSKLEVGKANKLLCVELEDEGHTA
jgi:hypothetical protein